MSRLPAIFCWRQQSQRLIAGRKTAEAAESVIDVNKNKHVCKRNVHFLTQCECYLITLKCIIFIFSYRRKPNVPSSLQVRKTKVNKQHLFLALSEDFFRRFCWWHQSSLLQCRDNFTILLTLLTSALPVWTASTAVYWTY